MYKNVQYPSNFKENKNRTKRHNLSSPRQNVIIFKRTEQYVG